MADPFIGEIRLVGFSFAPRNWAFCNGQHLIIADYQALYSLLGTEFGGDGRVTFGIPDLRGRVPVHQGQGPGLFNVVLGERGGRQTHIMNQLELPIHDHGAEFIPTGGGTGNPVDVTVEVPVSSAPGTVKDPDDNIPAQVKPAAAVTNAFAPTSAATGKLGGVTATATGGGGGITGGTVNVYSAGQSQPIQILPPFQVLNFIISLEGDYPERP